MAPTLAELRAQSGPKPLPRYTKVVTLVEGQHLLAESEALADELRSISTDAVRFDADGERTGPPRKAGEGSELPPRADAIRARQAAILDDLAEFQGEVGLTGVEGGEWQRFKDDHPPRDGHQQDLRLTGGRCHSGAVFAALGRFVSSWNGEDVAETDWDTWLAERITYADRREMITTVVKMHEDGLARSPKFLTSSPTTSPSGTG